MRKLIFCGDIHGDIKLLTWELTEKYKLSDCDVLVLGDFGVGFGKPRGLEEVYKKIKGRLERKNIKIWAIRGNHDDPKYFDGSVVFPHLELLPDNKIVEICGKTIFPIGGGPSEDQEWRIKRNKGWEKLGSSKRLWWEGERISRLDQDDFPIRVDYIVSHIAPISFLPVPIRDPEISPDIWEQIISDRRYLEDINTFVLAERWFYGHYHRSYIGESGQLRYRGLGIRELYEVNDISN